MLYQFQMALEEDVSNRNIICSKDFFTKENFFSEIVLWHLESPAVHHSLFNLYLASIIYTGKKLEIFSLVIFKLDGKMSTTVVHTTNIVKNTLNPSWDTFSISLRTLCNGDYERPIQFDVYDWDNDSDNDLIG